jgi:glycerol uptake facilitator-like aquaporin
MKQRHIAALLAEALGTFVLVLVVLNVSRYGLPFFTAMAAGLTVAAFTSAFNKISGAQFNPAFTLGLFSIRQITFVRTVAYLVAQAVAALGAWQLYQYFTDRTLKNATTPFDWRIFIAEAVGALVFSLGAIAAVTQKFEGWQKAATVGTALFLGITVAGLASNGIVNPAVALGVRSFDLNYFLGPVVGFILGALLSAYVLFPVLGFGKNKTAAAAKTVASAPKAEVKSAPVAKKAPAKKAPAKKAPAKKTAKK